MPSHHNHSNTSITIGGTTTDLGPAVLIVLTCECGEQLTRQITNKEDLAKLTDALTQEGDRIFHKRYRFSLPATPPEPEPPVEAFTEEDHWYSAKEIAAKLNLSRALIYQATQDGRLPLRTMMIGTSRRYSGNDLAAFLTKNPDAKLSKRRQNFTPKERLDIKSLFAGGMSKEELAELFDASYAGIHGVIKDT